MASSAKKAQGKRKGAGAPRRTSSRREPSDAQRVKKRSADRAGGVRPAGRVQGRKGTAANGATGGPGTEGPAPSIELGQADEQFRLMQDVAKIGCWSWDIASGRTTWSDGVYAMFGAPRKEPSYEFARSFVHPNDLDLWETAIQAAVDRKGPFSLDYRVVRSDGETIWVHNDTVAEFDGEGKFAGYKGTVQDITERKHAEEQMRLYMMMFECSTEAIAISDAEGRLVYMNPAHERLFGRSLAEARGLDYRAYYPPESIEVLDREVAPALAQGKHWEGELDALDAAGRRFPLWERADAMLDADGRLLFAFGFMHDVSEQRRAEKALQESEERFRRLLQSMPSVAVQGYGPDGTVQCWNEASERLYGYSAEEALGRSLLDLIILPEMRGVVEQAIREMAHTGVPIPAAEWTLRRKNGTRVFVFSSHAIVHLTGRPQELFCIDVDLTERKQAEDALRDSRQLLDAAESISRTGGWEWDVAAQTMSWTNGTYRIHDFDPASISPASPEHIAHSLACYDPEDRARVEEAFRQCVEEGQAYDIESSFTTAAGRRLRVRTMGQAIQEDGRIVKVQGNLQDITQLRRAEEELLESEERYRTVADFTYDWEYWVGPDGRLLYCSPSCERLTGYRAAEFENDPNLLTSVTHPSDRDWAMRHSRDVNRPEADMCRHEFRIRARSGEVRWIGHVCTAVHSADGAYLGRRASNRDITARKGIEETLRNSEKFHLAILDGFRDNMAVLDEHGTILFVNEPWRRFAEANGASAAAVSEGANYLHVCDSSIGDGAQEARLFSEAIRRVLSGERQSFALEYACHSPAKERWYEGRVMAVRFETEPRVAVTHQDITERKRAERALEEQRGLLRSLASKRVATEEQERKRIASYLHDEVGQSLAALRVNLATWKGAKSPPQRRRLLREIERLIDETIDETRSLTFELSPPLLFELGLGPALDALGEKLFSGTGTSFTFHDDGFGGRPSDEFASAMYRIGREALLNALKHADAGNVSLSLSMAENRACMEVTDDGRGMESSRFQEALHGRGGTYGLFSINERLHSLRGAIEIESSRGKGTRVRITVPFLKAESHLKGGSS